MSRSYPRIIIFIGPHGAGKTTQAYLLLKTLKKLSLHANIVSFDQGVMYQNSLLFKLLNGLCNMLFRSKKCPNDFLRKLFFLFIIKYIVNLLFSTIKFKIFKFSRKSILLEHEGFYLKQLTRLLIFAKDIRIKRYNILCKIIIFTLMTLLKERPLIIYLKCNYSDIKSRNIHAGQYYIKMQSKAYDLLSSVIDKYCNVEVIKINCSLSPYSVHKEVIAQLNNLSILT